MRFARLLAPVLVFFGCSGQGNCSREREPSDGKIEVALEAALASRAPGDELEIQITVVEPDIVPCVARVLQLHAGALRDVQGTSLRARASVTAIGDLATRLEVVSIEAAAD